MITIHYFENKTVVLSQLVRNIPAVNDAVKIKGRKGKIDAVEKIGENTVHAYVTFEKLRKSEPVGKRK
ncbi:hypothetical protein [Bacillus rubiinfantis]|uniref:hypothetical protein n=1 Tax=Bacillus rubiinfantis TaxID=1499680 RepID=UPI0005A9B583|nr:hypothetical protein [Bacillus rubiinfantis]